MYFKFSSVFPSQDVFYHFLALLFYFAAFTLEAAVTAANRGSFKLLSNGTLCTTYHPGNIFTLLDDRQYNINVAATVSVTASTAGRIVVL